MRDGPRTCPVCEQPLFPQPSSPRRGPCSECLGTGRQRPKEAGICGTCNGSGFATALFVALALGSHFGSSGGSDD